MKKLISVLGIAALFLVVTMPSSAGKWEARAYKEAVCSDAEVVAYTLRLYMRQTGNREEAVRMEIKTFDSNLRRGGYVLGISKDHISWIKKIAVAVFQEYYSPELVKENCMAKEKLWPDSANAELAEKLKMNDE